VIYGGGQHRAKRKASSEGTACRSGPKRKKEREMKNPSSRTCLMNTEGIVGRKRTGSTLGSNDKTEW